MVHVFTSMSSDAESDDGVGSYNVYKKKYDLILQRCEDVQRDNERLVHRIHRVKKILKRKQKERKFLMQRLDKHGDRWRSISMPFELNDPSPGKGSSSSGALGHSSKSKSSKTSPSDKSSKKSKSSSSHSHKKKASSKPDKNAPKRPGNPYFQFCQEQRSSVIEEMSNTGLPGPTKTEVTKQLASKWNTLSSEDRKIYYDMYERSKEKWNAEMQRYTLSKGSTSQ